MKAIAVKKLLFSLLGLLVILESSLVIYIEKTSGYLAGCDPGWWSFALTKPLFGPVAWLCLVAMLVLGPVLMILSLLSRSAYHRGHYLFRRMFGTTLSCYIPFLVMTPLLPLAFLNRINIILLFLLLFLATAMIILLKAVSYLALRSWLRMEDKPILQSLRHQFFGVLVIAGPQYQGRFSWFNRKGLGMQKAFRRAFHREEVLDEIAVEEQEQFRWSFDTQSLELGKGYKTAFKAIKWFKNNDAVFHRFNGTQSRFIDLYETQDLEILPDLAQQLSEIVLVLDSTTSDADWFRFVQIINQTPAYRGIVIASDMARYRALLQIALPSDLALPFKLRVFSTTGSVPDIKKILHAELKKGWTAGLERLGGLSIGLQEAISAQTMEIPELELPHLAKQILLPGIPFITELQRNVGRETDTPTQVYLIFNIMEAMAKAWVHEALSLPGLEKERSGFPASLTQNGKAGMVDMADDAAFLKRLTGLHATDSSTMVFIAKINAALPELTGDKLLPALQFLYCAFPFVDSDSIQIECAADAFVWASWLKNQIKGHGVVSGFVAAAALPLLIRLCATLVVHRLASQHQWILSDQEVIFQMGDKTFPLGRLVRRSSSPPDYLFLEGEKKQQQIYVGYNSGSKWKPTQIAI